MYGTLWDAGLQPGAFEGLKRLSRDYGLFLVSNCHPSDLDNFLDITRLRGVFKDALCSGQTGKPKSENIRQIMRKHGLGKSVYIGDTQGDQEAAYTAGAGFIFAKYGFGSAPVSCPAVDSIGELVQRLTAPAGVPEVTVRRLEPGEFERARTFYLSVGYQTEIAAADRFFAAFGGGNMVGLVRLASEHGHRVLRGMQVEPWYQFFGIGTRLIRLLEADLNGDPCFCLPHRWLDRFYGQIGFRTVEDTDEVPAFLTQRWAEVRSKYPQVILMMRPNQRMV